MKAFSCLSADALILPVDLVDIMNAPKPRWGTSAAGATWME
ncbi:hypothetical protein QMZ05_27245 [Bradyrhizobium sp. INPA03-11B]